MGKKYIGKDFVKEENPNRVHSYNKDTTARPFSGSNTGSFGRAIRWEYGSNKSDHAGSIKANSLRDGSAESMGLSPSSNR